MSNQYRNVDEEVQVARAVEGDPGALDELLKAYRGSIYQLCYRILNHREDAEDATQDALLAASRAISSFERKASFRTWIVRIAVNTAANHHHRRSRRWTNLSETDVAAEEKVTKLLQIQQTLQKLSFFDRSILILKDMEGLSYKDIGEVLKIPIGTVASKLFRARERFLRIYKGL